MKDNLFRILLAALLCVPLAFGFPMISLLMLASLLTYNLVKNSVKDFAIIAAAALLLMAVIFRGNIPLVLSFYVPLVLVAYVLGIRIRKKQSFSGVMISAVIAAIASIVLVLLYYTHTTGKTAFTLIFGQYVELIKPTFAQLDMPSDFVDLLVQQLELMMPSFIIISATFTVYIVFCISRKLLERKGYIIDNMPHFEELSLNRTFTTVFLFILLFSFFGSLSAVSLNIIIVVVTLFSVCGLSVLVYYLKTLGLPVVIRGLIYIIFFATMLFSAVLGGIPMFILIIIGIVDSYRPLRLIRGE